MHNRSTILAAILCVGALPATATVLGSFTTFQGGGSPGGARTTGGAGTYLGGVEILEHTFDLTNLPTVFTYTLDSSQQNFNSIAGLLTNGTNDGISFFWSIGGPPSPVCCGGSSSESSIFFPFGGNVDFHGFTVTSVVLTFDQLIAPTQVINGQTFQFWEFRENITVNGALTTPAPEPETALLLGPSLVSVYLLRRRRGGDTASY
jgi:hypothetical protein